MSNKEGIKSPDIQEVNPVESRPFHTDSHVESEVMAGDTDQIKGRLSAELFEEKLEEINRELRKFDTAADSQPKSNFPTGKENIVESMTINEMLMKATQARATPSGSTRAPLTVLSDVSNSNTVNAATWKRQVREQRPGPVCYGCLGYMEEKERYKGREKRRISPKSGAASSNQITEFLAA
nr:hypothetical protein CFP56_25042 [Quercus suber]